MNHTTHKPVQNEFFRVGTRRIIIDTSLVGNSTWPNKEKRKTAQLPLMAVEKQSLGKSSTSPIWLFDHDPSMDQRMDIFHFSGTSFFFLHLEPTLFYFCSGRVRVCDECVCVCAWTWSVDRCQLGLCISINMRCQLCLFVCREKKKCVCYYSTCSSSNQPHPCFPSQIEFCLICQHEHKARRNGQDRDLKSIRLRLPSFFFRAQGHNRRERERDTEIDRTSTNNKQSVPPFIRSSPFSTRVIPQQ